MPIVLVSPHPDDETLGAGGLLAACRGAGIPVTVIAVTDGENAYQQNDGLGAVREQEQSRALDCLGVASDHIHRLRLTDSGLMEQKHLLVEALRPLVSFGSHVIAPWHGDFHPDHEACGAAAAAVVQEKGATLTSYLFWTWHRGTPATLTGQKLVRFPLTPELVALKLKALHCHQSQLAHAGEPPILPSYLLQPAMRPFEVFVMA
ncbi:PIG-L family deacetylase [Acidipila sp. EB88]|nr:PIG-L family deacetylase [Acidipila sp. EB88]